MEYDGPKLEIFLRDMKQDNSKELLQQMFSNLTKTPSKLGMFLKDKPDGDISQKAIDFIATSGH